MSIAEKKLWNPIKNLLATSKDNNYALVILNTPINFNKNPRIIADLWSQAKVRLTVDGGTERWLAWKAAHKSQFDNLPEPDLITGDMDSLSKDILKQYLELGSTKVIRTPDQDETDFSKALKELKNYCGAQSIELDTVYVLVDNWGRFDQIMANINTLYKCNRILPNINVFLVASGSITWLLAAGSHEIKIHPSLIGKQDWCALLPVGGPSKVTTMGLKWNLDNQELKFGALVSSSNTYEGSSQVNIKTDEPLVWSMSIEPLL